MMNWDRLLMALPLGRIKLPTYIYCLTRDTYIRHVLSVEYIENFSLLEYYPCKRKGSQTNFL